MSPESLIYAAAIGVAVLIPTIYIWREEAKSRNNKRRLEKAIARGQDEPPTLHPIVDHDRCIGSACCVKACPEHGVLGLVNGKAVLVNPSRCIGHGVCREACPVGAITLVFGTARRGIEIPDLSADFETTQPGIHIAGELGGMGLIKNAVIQGQEAMDRIAGLLPPERSSEIDDVLIVGSGPAGIAATLRAKELGLRTTTIDQQDLGGTILNYPRRKLVLTQPMHMPGHGKLKIRTLLKEELLEIFRDVFRKNKLQVRAGLRVEEIHPQDDGFEIVLADGERLRAHRVLLAIGRGGSPRKLGVPGEDSGIVAYNLLDAEQFKGSRVLVVGGGDSAVEAAIALAEEGAAEVWLSYRRARLFRAKEENELRLDKLVSSGQVRTLMPSEVQRIEQRGRVLLKHQEQERQLEVDQVLVFAGGQMPAEFLQRVGIRYSMKHGEP